MKKIISLSILFLFFIAVGKCEKYMVFTAKGTITSSGKTVAVGNELSETSNVKIPSGGVLSVIDEANNRVITVKGEYSGSVKAMLSSGNASKRDVTGKYMSYLKQKLTNPESSSKHMQTGGTVYRETDSLTLERLKNMEVGLDSIAE